MKSSLDAFPGLLEGLSLGDLGWVVGTDTHDVSAGENEDIGDELQRRDEDISHCRPHPDPPVPKLELPASILANTHRAASKQMPGSWEQPSRTGQTL